MKNTVLVLAGPTAVGKTAVAIAVAKQFGAEIISADSRQCYRELQIGVARPSLEELATVPHHFIASHSISQKVTAATFESEALLQIEQLFKKGNIVVVTGGTGLYIKALCEGFDPIPEIPAFLRQALIETYEKKGLAWLQKAVQTEDPLFYATGDVQNPHRLLRALEVVQGTGTSITVFQKGKKNTRNFDIIKLALHLPKEALHARINARVDAMLQQGLLNEVTQLLPYKPLPALQTVGYTELFQYLNNELSWSQAIEAIKQNTRRYAKRQLTWFRKDKEYTWMPPDANTVLTYLKTRIQPEA